MNNEYITRMADQLLENAAQLFPGEEPDEATITQSALVTACSIIARLEKIIEATPGWDEGRPTMLQVLEA